MLPLIIWGGISLISGIAGAGGVLSAKEKFEKAENIGKNAQRKYNREKRNFEEIVNALNIEIEKLSKLKLKLYQTTLSDFIKIFSKFGKLNKKNNFFYEENIKANLQDIKNQIDYCKKFSTALMEGMGQGAVGIIGLLGTGVAIETLGGIVGTELVGLGLLESVGLASVGALPILCFSIGPFTLITGIYADSKAEEALTEARKYEAKVDAAIEKIKSKKIFLNGLEKRVKEVESVLQELNKRLVNILEELNTIYNSKVKLFDTKSIASTLNEEELFYLTSSYKLAVAMKEVLKTPIINKNGEITKEIGLVIKQAKRQLIN